MKIAAPPARTAALLLIALLSSSSAPAATQRRPASRQTTRQTTRPTARPPAPPDTGPRTSAQAQPTRPGAASSPAAQTERPAEAVPAEAAGEPRGRAAVDERTFEEMLGADSYGVYVEVRKVTMAFEAPEIKTALGAAALFDKDAAELLQLANFINENAEVLADARVALAIMPTRANLPQPLVAVQLPSAEAARLFEPKFRAFVGERRQSLGALAEAPGVRRGRGRGGRGTRARAPRPAPAPRVVLRQVGSWLLAADRPFTLRRLGGAAGSLADSARFQNLRARFANDSVFVYFDTERTQLAWAVQMQRQMEAAEAAEAARPPGGPKTAADEVSEHVDGEEREHGDGPSEGDPEHEVGRLEDAPPPPPAPARPRVGVVGGPVVVQVAPPGTEGTGTTTPPPPGEEVQGEISVIAPEGAPEAIRAAPPTEAEVAGRHFSFLLGSLFGGIPRLPGAAAAGLSIDGGSIALRVAVETVPDAPVGLIPFLPNVVAGPPVAVETSAVAPASNDILVATTLDWVQIFDSLVGATRERLEQLRQIEASVQPEPDPDVPGAAEERAAGVESQLALVEKVLGFKLRQDFLPTLGNEIAVSLPLDLFTRIGRISPRGREKGGGQEEPAAEPGFVAIVALNDPDRLRPMLPKLALLLGMAGGAQPAAEKRAGYELSSIGPFTYSIVDRFLIVSDDAPHVRHAVDSYARGETLAQTNAYRDSVAWQAAQRLAHAYVSPGLMSTVIRETKRMGEGSEDPLVVSTLPQLDLPAEAVTFAATNEGDVLVHELRLPVSLGRVYTAAAVIASRESGNVGAEAMVSAALNSIYYAQMSYRERKDRDRYATLEELIAEGLVEKTFVQREDYRVEVTAVGDRFEVTATPRNYGKTGRRSFYLDQSGVVRAADHKGRPATADDPPVD